MEAAAAGGEEPESPLERSSHTAFTHQQRLYVWGGYRVVCGEEFTLPSNEIWICDLDSGTWERRYISGVFPQDLLDFCGSNVGSTFYIFGGIDAVGHTNQMFSVDLSQSSCSWRKVTDARGTTPSPRSKHSCWVHRNRLIYFGGYGCKTLGQAQSMSSSSYIVEEMSWTTIGDMMFRCWGFNNEVNVFDTRTETWTVPETQGPAPAPRGCHASALLGNKGYISGGAEKAELDMFSLDLDTWTWTKLDVSQSVWPPDRSLHSMTGTSDHDLFVYGGLGTDGETLNDAWQFNTVRREWTKRTYPHKDKPRVCHTASPGSDGDVVVFGGSSKLCIFMDSVAVLRAPSENHCRDVIIFQTQPYSLFRLCQDFIGKNPALFAKQLNFLPSKLRSKVDKRVSFFSNVTVSQDENERFTGRLGSAVSSIFLY